MTLRHFMIFAAVFEDLSMTKAAKRLHMTQPSVSQAISELESYYGRKLFERLGRRLYATDAGRQLLPYAQEILKLTARAEAVMHDGDAQYPIRLGASLTIGETVLIDVLLAMKDVAPTQEIFTEVHNTEVLETMLLEDSLDMALIEGTVRSPSLLVEPFMTDELVVVLPPDSPYIGRETLTAQELASLSYFLREDGSGTRQLFEDAMRAHEIPLHIKGVYNNSETLKRAVAGGLGATVLSKRLVEEEVERGELGIVRSGEFALKREFVVVCHKGKYLSQGMRELRSVLDGLVH